MRDLSELRLDILRIVMPHTVKFDVSDPKRIIEKCAELERYILDGKNETGQYGGATSAARRRGRKAKVSGPVE